MDNDMLIPRVVDALGISRAGTAQQVWLQTAVREVQQEEDPAQQTLARATITEAHGILLDAKGYDSARDATWKAANTVADPAEASEIFYRLAAHFWRLGDQQAVRRAVVELQRRATGIPQPADRYEWLARATGLWLRLGDDEQAQSTYQAVQQAISQAGLHSHIAVVEDFQYYGRVIAYAEAEAISLAVLPENYPKTFAGVDTARGLAALELAAAAARTGDALAFATFRTEAEALLADRKRSPQAAARVQTTLAHSLAMAGHLEAARQRAAKVDDEPFRSDAWLAVAWAEAERQQAAGAMDSYAQVQTGHLRPLVAFAVARAALQAGLPDADRWAAGLGTHAERAAAAAGFAAAWR
jgi:hypothetical protein